MSNTLPKTAQSMAKKHYYLEEFLAPIKRNAMRPLDQKTIPLRAMGKAQQALQLNFHKNADDPTIRVINVVLLNFVYLGHMTESDFNKSPDGTVLSEVTGNQRSLN